MSTSVDRRLLQRYTWPCAKQAPSPEEGLGQALRQVTEALSLKASQAVSGHISFRA